MESPDMQNEPLKSFKPWLLSRILTAAKMIGDEKTIQKTLSLLDVQLKNLKDERQLHFLHGHGLSRSA